jgi:hypothetical protein
MIHQLALSKGLGDNDVSRRDTPTEKQVDRMQLDAFSISVYGTPGTTEYRAATLLRDLIRQAALPTDKGTVSIRTDAYFPGQKREQIDLLLHAYFPKGLTRKVKLLDSVEEIDVAFQDILAVIEVKAHSKKKVFFGNTGAEVLYGDTWKSASSQSHAQTFSAKPFLTRQLGWSPWVCNLIFFSNLVKADLPPGSHYYLASDSTFQDLLEKLYLSKNRTDSNARFFNCTFGHDAATRELRNKQLQEQLKTYQHEAQHSPPPLARNWPRRRYWRTPSIFRPFRFRSRYRGTRSRTGFLMMSGIVCLLMIGGMVHLFSRVRPYPDISLGSASPVAAQPPVLHLCESVTPSCGCVESVQFRRGKTINLQFVSLHQRPVSEFIQDPQGRLSPLSFRHLNLSSKYFEGSCFNAKYTIGQEALTGPYSVQVTSEIENSHTRTVLSKGFRVTP